jgi:hypothetical protein
MNIFEQLKDVQAEYDTAAAKGDIEECKRIVERAGLTWLEPALPEKYKTDAHH